MSVPKKRRGRPPPPRGVELYTSCARKRRFKPDGSPIPCGCKTCAPGGW